MKKEKIQEAIQLVGAVGEALNAIQALKFTDAPAANHVIIHLVKLDTLLRGELENGECTQLEPDSASI